MDWRHATYALAIVFVVAGGIVLGIGTVEYASEIADERACRAANDGLDELQCMNFGGIAYGFALMWSGGLAGVGASIAALTWLVGRGRGASRRSAS